MQTASTNSATKGERTKAALRVVAAECFKQFGFQAATTAEIARRAGIAEGTIFLHYSSKLGLLTAVTVDFYQQLQEEGERMVSDDGASALQQLRNLLDSWSRQMSRHWDLIQVFLQVAQANTGSELATTVRESNRRYNRLFVGLIDKLKTEHHLPAGVPTSLLRDMLIGALEHRARSQQYAGKPIDTTRSSQQVLDLLLKQQDPAAMADSERLDAIESKLDRLLSSRAN